MIEKLLTGMLKIKSNKSVLQNYIRTNSEWSHLCDELG